MAYSITITDHADELINFCTLYIIEKLKNPQAAKHLLDGIDVIYDCLESNPYLFPDSSDPYLRGHGYKVGLFHNLQDYDATIIVDLKSEQE